MKNAKNVIKFGDHSTFHGDVAVAVAKKIEGSFNKAQAAQSSDDIKAVLQQLAQEVANLAEKLSEDKAAELADDLERLTDEATKDNPRRKWWELSAEGILEAAKSVGEVGTTSISLVEKLLPLLG